MYSKKRVVLNKKKILVFIGASYVSGLEVVTLHLIRQLKERGHDVRCVVNGWNDGVFKQKLDKAEIPWYEVKLGWLYVTKPWWTLDTLIHWPGAYLRCRKILRDFDPEVCHCCMYSNVLMLYPLLKGRKLVYNLQESQEATRKSLWIYKKLDRRIALYTAVSGHIVKVLRNLQIPSEKIRLIYNGVPLLTSLPEQPAPDRPPVLGIIGQVASWKGHETLIDAVGILASSGEAADLTVSIFGNDKNAYATVLQDKIAKKGLERYFVWKGFVPDQQAIYRQVDIVAVPSLSGEPCSLTVLESMMRGKGVIVSDRGGNPELVEDRHTGLVFPATDANALAECIRLFLRDPEFAADMGRKAAIAARQKYTDICMTDNYIKAYMELWS
jgi:glycosyltransferase involved in cell wall biosynthesis